MVNDQNMYLLLLLLLLLKGRLLKVEVFVVL